VNLFRQLMEKPWLTDESSVVELRAGRAFALPQEKLGLRVFLAVVMVVFSLMTAAYVERKVFADWHSVPLPWLLWLNTVILIFGSIAMHRAWTSARRGQIDGVRPWLNAGGYFVFAFLAGQLLVWRELVASGYYVAGDPANSFFYMLTAAHGVHLIGGLVAWGRTVAKIRRGESLDRVAISVELCTIYWHFLLLIWLAVFALMLLT
jgi:cytochrome c oxidase subunit 3